MAFIRISCGCGRVMKVDTVHAGKKVKCPECGSLAVIPGEGRETTSGPIVAPGATSSGKSRVAPPPETTDAGDPGAGEGGGGDWPPAAPAAKSAGTPSGKSKTSTPSGKSLTATASGKSAAAPAAAKDAAEPAAAKAGGTVYDLLGAILGLALVGLVFIPWVELRDRKDTNLYRATGFQIMTNADSERKTTVIQTQFFDKPDVLAALKITREAAVEGLTGKYFDAAWVPFLVYGYLGLAGLTAVLGLVNKFTGAIGGKPVGIAMTLAGLVCMGALAVVMFVANKPPAELGTAFAESFKYKGIIPSFAVLGLAFVLFGFGVIYALTGGASGGRKPLPKRPSIGGTATSSTFEMPE